MKKKEFNNNLKLGKKVISNLQQNNLQGGTNPIAVGTYIIINTVKILTEHITRRICPTDTLSVDTECP